MVGFKKIYIIIKLYDCHFEIIWFHLDFKAIFRLQGYNSCFVILYIFFPPLISLWNYQTLNPVKGNLIFGKDRSIFHYFFYIFLMLFYLFLMFFNLYLFTKMVKKYLRYSYKKTFGLFKMFSRCHLVLYVV